MGVFKETGKEGKTTKTKDDDQCLPQRVQSHPRSRLAVPAGAAAELFRGVRSAAGGGFWAEARPCASAAAAEGHVAAATCYCGDKGKGCLETQKRSSALAAQ